MIILAAAVVITLNNTNIINRANQVVEESNLKEVQHIATLAWAEAYLNKEDETTMLQSIRDALVENGADPDNYEIEVTENGVNVTITLGKLVKSAADYGKTVNYVSDNGVTGWKVFYETDDYVYLIASEKIPYDKRPQNIPNAKLKTKTDIPGYEDWYICWQSAPDNAGTIQNASMWMADGNDYSNLGKAKCVSYFLDETYWEEYKNTSAQYASYVEGAIGTPTAEMFVASWNAKREATGDTTIYNKKLSLVEDGTNGYFINDITTTNPATTNEHVQSISTDDSLYIWSTDEDTGIWLASLSSENEFALLTVGESDYTGYNGYIEGHTHANSNLGLRPVVCLSSKVPAKIGTTTDFEI